MRKWSGDVFCRSYINFYIANQGIVAPAYGIPKDDDIRLQLEQLFPGRAVTMVDLNDIAPGGGGIHCITQQQPASVRSSGGSGWQAEDGPAKE